MSLHFSLHFFLLDGFPFIMLFFPFCKTDLDLCKVFFIEENTKRNECISFFFQLRFNFIDLSFLQQQFSISHRIMIVYCAMRVLSNVQILQPHFSFMNEAITVGKISLSL